MRFLGHAIRKEKLEYQTLTALIPEKEHRVDNGKHIYNSLVKPQTVLSMMHVTNNMEKGYSLGNQRMEQTGCMMTMMGP